MFGVRNSTIDSRWRRPGGAAVALLLLLLMVFAAAPLAGAAEQPAVEIVFLLDDSASITPSNYAIEQQGLASALGDPAIMPQDGSVAVAVVQFSTTVRTLVPLQTITALNVSGISSMVLMSQQEGQSTALAAGLRAATAALQGGAPGTRKIICVITDGMPDDPCSDFWMSKVVGGKLGDDDSIAQANLQAPCSTKPAIFGVPNDCSAFNIPTTAVDDVAFADNVLREPLCVRWCDAGDAITDESVVADVYRHN